MVRSGLIHLDKVSPILHVLAEFIGNRMEGCPADGDESKGQYLEMMVILAKLKRLAAGDESICDLCWDYGWIARGGFHSECPECMKFFSEMPSEVISKSLLYSPPPESLAYCKLEEGDEEK